jgi:hypothetical protein
MTVGIMIDTESLGLAPSSVMTQFAAIAFPLDDPETILREIEEFLPAQPQMDRGRTLEFDTILWLLGQPDKVRKIMDENRGDDFDEVVALVRSVARKIEQVIEDSKGDYEIWMRRPQHDEPMIRSLFKLCGVAIPWKYDTVNDLASILNQAKVSKGEVDKTGTTLHTAIGDCRFQIRCYIEAMRRLRSAN